MNPTINKVIKEIERTKAKIAELQALLPELERKQVDLENAEIVRLVRKATVKPEDLAGYLENYSQPSAGQVSASKLTGDASPVNQDINSASSQETEIDLSENAENDSALLDTHTTQ